MPPFFHLKFLIKLGCTDRGETPLAIVYFDAAMRNGAPFEPYYYLAEYYSSQATNTGLPAHVASSSCSMAVSFYKRVAERGVWEDDLLRDAEVAWMSQENQDKEVAMLKWWLGAERGYEIAQNNLGYVLDQGMLSRLADSESHSDTSHRQKHSSPDPILAHDTVQ